MSGARIRPLALLLGTVMTGSVARGSDFSFVPASDWALPGGAVRAMVFAPDGSWLAVASGGTTKLYDLPKQGLPKLRGELTAGRQVLGLAVSPDGLTLASVDDSGMLNLFDTRSLSAIVSARAHRGRTRAVTFTSDGSYLVTGGRDGQLRVWTARGQPYADLGGGFKHTGEIVLVAPMAPGRRVLSVGKDRRIILWDLDTQQPIRPTSVDSDILSAAIGGDGKTLAVGLQSLTGNRFRSAQMDDLAHGIQSDDRVRLIDADRGTQLVDFAGEKQDLRSVSVTPDGQFVAATGSEGYASIWDSATGKKITNIPLPEAATTLVFAPDGSRMVAGDEAGHIFLFKLSGVRPAPAAAIIVQGAPVLIFILEPATVDDNGRDSQAVSTIVSTPSLRVRGRIKSASPLRSLTVDGVEVTSIQSEEPGSYRFSTDLQLQQPGKRSVEIVAEDEHGGLGRHRLVVERAPEVRKPAPGPGRRLALIIGISKYADPGINLDFASADAQSLFSLLTDPALGPAAFQKDDVRLLLDEQATVKEITTGLREFLRKAGENDFVVFFFAGHGAPDPDHLTDLYLLAHDTDPKNIAGSGLLMRHVQDAIRDIPARDVLVLSDACHSAGIGTPPGLRSLSTNAINQAFLEKTRHASGGLAILTASEAAQVSFENPRWNKHGVFTYFVLEGLRGAADTDGDGIVALGELIEFVRDSVRKETRYQQIPAISSTTFDRQLPLAIVTGKKPPF